MCIRDRGATRISFDFRVIPAHLFKEDGKRSVTQGKQFIDGDYYKTLEGI